MFLAVQSFTLTHDDKVAVIEAQWDPLSPMYLLVAYANGNVDHMLYMLLLLHCSPQTYARVRPE